MSPNGIIAAVGTWAMVTWVLPSYRRLLTEGGLQRPNYTGRPIPVSTGLLPGLVAAIAVALLGTLGNALGHICAVATLTAMLVGLLDDTAGDRRSSGLKGHFTALVRGQLSTGAVKALTIPVIALVTASTLGRPILWTLVDTAVISLSANAINLLDVRPGRAIKGVLLLMVAALLGGLDAVGMELWVTFLAAALAYAPVDFRGLAMLGDSGANALGIAAGMFYVLAWPPLGRVGMLVALVSLHLISERYSLSDLIERNRMLNAIDRWGR